MLQRITSVYIFLLLTVFLLAFSADGYGAISDVKHGLFMLICGGYVLIMAILRLMYVITGTRGIGNIRDIFKETSVATKFLIGFLLATILSTLFATYPGSFRGEFRSEGLLTIGIYVLSCYIVSIYFSPKKWMLFTLGISMVPVSVIALIQLTGANPFTLYPLGHNFYGAGIYYSGQFLSTIGNSGLLAAFLCLAVGVLAMALIKFDFKERWYLSFPFFITLLLIFEKGINAAVFSLVVGSVLILPVAITNRKSFANTLIVCSMIKAAFALSQVLVFQDGPILFDPIPVLTVIAAAAVALLSVLVLKVDIFEKFTTKQYRVGAVILMFAAMCTALAFVWLQGMGTSGMIYEASHVMRGNVDDTFGTRRIYIWRNVIEHIQLNTLLLGTGPDTLGHWPIPPFTRLTDDGIYLTSIIDSAHNEPLHILATGGLLSLITYLGALLFAAIKWIKLPENTLSAVAGAGVLFYVLQALFGISQFITAPFFWTCFGVLLFAQSKEYEREQV